MTRKRSTKPVVICSYQKLKNQLLFGKFQIYILDLVSPPNPSLSICVSKILMFFSLKPLFKSFI